MHILLLGPPCTSIETHLARCGHKVTRTDKVINSDYLQDKNIDFGISYRYKNIIRKPEISFFTGKLVNLHISLLPWNRGLDPNLWSFLENTPKGVTIHQVDAGLDTGDILLQKEHTFELSCETLRTSYESLSQMIENLFIQNSEAILRQEITPIPQGEGGSLHRGVDKTPYLFLFKAKGWETPVEELTGKALQPLE